jgi:hypothetical protein
MMWIKRKRRRNNNRRYDDDDQSVFVVGILLIFLTFIVTTATADNTDVVENADNTTISTQEVILEPNLPFGDINLLVVSDVHSFVGGHPHEPDRNADYGDLYSFHERLKEYINNDNNNNGRDLWLLNNGDWLHGTGLAMDGNATNLLPIINSMPWDALSMGNHEAMYSDVLHDMKESMLPKFPGKYITSNVLWNNAGNTSIISEDGNNKEQQQLQQLQPFGERYQLLKGRNSTVLVFGFLYDMERPSQMIQVVPVEETIEEDWFRDVLVTNNKHNDENGEVQKYYYDAIIVMAHMGNDNPLIDIIYEKIRSYVDPKMPIQFITGHSHTRSFTNSIKRDHYVHKLLPGGLFDTIGWVTIPKFDKAQTLDIKELNDGTTNEFQHQFLNTSKSYLHSTLFGDDSVPSLRTPKGDEISNLIKDTQTKLELDQIVACPGKDYYRNVSIHDDNSLWKLWRDHVVKTQIFQKDTDRVMLVSKKTFRYDLRGSGIGKHDDDAMTLDDVIAIAPYMEKVIYVGDVPDWMIRRMNNTFNTYSHHNIIPDYILAGDLDEIKTADTYQLYTHEVDVPKIKAKLEKFNFQNFVLKYTGNRDTLYWLDYVRTAFPCKGLNEKEEAKIMKTKPYFYDPNELEEEDTDGQFSIEDIDDDEDGDGDEGSDGDVNSEDIEWTLPPGDEYLGYVPGKGETHSISNDVYEKYTTPEEREKERNDKNSKASAANNKKHKSSGDLKSQLKERKKAQKHVIKMFALAFAVIILLVPVVCLVMQLTGQNISDDGHGDYDGIGIYDKEEMRSLRRKRLRGDNSKSSLPLHDRPLKEIEII